MPKLWECNGLVTGIYLLCIYLMPIDVPSLHDIFSKPVETLLLPTVP
jgi:hypothetical protein